MKESGIQTAIEQYLNYLENQGRLVYIKNNSGALKTNDRFIRFGKKGSPDFFVFLHNGRCIHLEVKNEKGKQNDNQKAYQSKIEKLDHTYLIARSIDDVENCLKSSDLVQ
ncbi:MAG: VRR-NUC domain-containing protein [Desulfobacteraceae bacterium]|nr:MAG: VRR-NUC domain-containing protein [Desulfobacteraceae bacterium]